MSTMEILRPIIRRIVMAGDEPRILAGLWAESYSDVPGSDVTADAILLAVAEFRQEREDLERLKARPEDETVGH